MNDLLLVHMNDAFDKVGGAALDAFLGVPSDYRFASVSDDKVVLVSARLFDRGVAYTLLPLAAETTMLSQDLEDDAASVGASMYTVEQL